MNIFFDLDGTLIDSRLRLYQLFQFLVPQSNLSFEGYWDLKRNKVNHRQILTAQFNYSEQDFEKFEKFWLLEIEKPNWLLLDKPFEGIIDMLMNLAQQHQLYIVTARQFEQAAINQIHGFGWTPYLTKILVTGQKLNKHDLIKNTIFVNSDDWLIGDTGKDIETGKKLGINTVAVLSGFLNKNSLVNYEPDFIINNTIEFTDIINGKLQK